MHGRLEYFFVICLEKHFIHAFSWKAFFFPNVITFLGQFVDDDGKCYLEINYTFDIRKEWPLTTSWEHHLHLENSLAFRGFELSQQFQQNPVTDKKKKAKYLLVLYLWGSLVLWDLSFSFTCQSAIPLWVKEFICLIVARFNHLHMDC